MSAPVWVRVRRLVRGWDVELARWEAEVVLGSSPNFTTTRALTKGGAVREARRRYERSLVPEERVAL